MLSFSQYIEKAKESKLIRNKSQIADILGISRAAIRNFEVQKSYPSEATILKLAKLANIKEKQALIDLNTWKSNTNPQTQKIWKELSEEQNNKQDYQHLSFRDYVEKAKNNSQIDSNNNVAKVIDISGSALAQFCTEKGYPSQETVLRLATLAGVSPEQALIDFNLWKTKDKPSAHKVWKELSEKLKFLSCVLVMASSLSSNCFSKENTPLIQADNHMPHIYYATIVEVRR